MSVFDINSNFTIAEYEIDGNVTGMVKHFELNCILFFTSNGELGRISLQKEHFIENTDISNCLYITSGPKNKN